MEENQGRKNILCLYVDAYEISYNIIHINIICTVHGHLQIQRDTGTETGIEGEVENEKNSSNLKAFVTKIGK